MRSRIKRWVHSYRLAILAGGLFALPLSHQAAGGPIGYLVALLACFLLGGLFGVVILTAIRFFRTERWGYPIAGLLAGSVPLIVVPMSGKDLGGLWVVSALLGLLIGLLEWERTSRLAREPDPTGS